MIVSKVLTVCEIYSKGPGVELLDPLEIGGRDII